MVAHQTAQDSFSVVDQEKGTVSYHKGNIATPHAAQSAFFAHGAKAQRLGQEESNNQNSRKKS